MIGIELDSQVLTGTSTSVLMDAALLVEALFAEDMLRMMASERFLD